MELKGIDDYSKNYSVTDSNFRPFEGAFGWFSSSGCDGPTDSEGLIPELHYSVALWWLFLYSNCSLMESQYSVFPALLKILTTVLSRKYYSALILTVFGDGPGIVNSDVTGSMIQGDIPRVPVFFHWWRQRWPRCPVVRTFKATLIQPMWNASDLFNDLLT